MVKLICLLLAAHFIQRFFSQNCWQDSVQKMRFAPLCSKFKSRKRVDATLWLPCYILHLLKIKQHCPEIVSSLCHCWSTEVQSYWRLSFICLSQLKTPSAMVNPVLCFIHDTSARRDIKKEYRYIILNHLLAIWMLHCMIRKTTAAYRNKLGCIAKP